MDKTKLKIFLWMWNVYQNFMAELAKVERPQNAMLKKGNETY